MLEKTTIKNKLFKETKAQFYYNRKKPYSTVPNSYLKDKNLSLKAKGLFTIMHALPEDWNFTIKGLQEISGQGEKTITNTLKELNEKHYITRVQKRKDNGQYYYEYIIWDEPTDTRYSPY